MKKILKSRIFLVIVCALVFTSIGVFADNDLLASRKVTYNDRRVDGALNELYQKAASINLEGKKVCKLIDETYGSYLGIGSKYECEVATGVKKNFYILKNNGREVTLIMERNITEGTNTTTMTWNNAMKYVDNNNLRTTWTNVLDVDLPKAQAIANAVGNTNWYAGDNNAWWCLETKQKDTSSLPYCYNNDGDLETLWLWDYTRECTSWHCQHSLGTTEAYGYWTRDLISNTVNAWYVDKIGILNYDPVSNSTLNGVRPVITVLQSNLYTNN